MTADALQALERVPMTDAEIAKLSYFCSDVRGVRIDQFKFARAIEAHPGITPPQAAQTEKRPPKIERFPRVTKSLAETILGRGLDSLTQGDQERMISAAQRRLDSVMTQLYTARLATSPQATPQPTPPAECKNGCPPLQICDFCQGTGGKDKPPQAAQTEAALREVVRLSEDAGLYDADFQTEAQEREAFEAWHLNMFLEPAIWDEKLACYSTFRQHDNYLSFKAGRAGSKP